MPGIYVVSIRRDLDPVATRAAGYAHVGLFVDAQRANDIALADSFTVAGFGASDIAALIDGLHGLATDPTSVGGDVFEPFGERGGVDTEGHPTSLFMFRLGGPDGSQDWLTCVEAAHTTWPRLLDLMGASVGATYINGDNHRTVRLPEIRVRRALRLRSGWDYDAEGNQVYLSPEEAWRRFVEYNEARPQERRLGTKTLRKIRRHMESDYAAREGATRGAATDLGLPSAGGVHCI